MDIAGLQVTCFFYFHPLRYWFSYFAVTWLGQINLDAKKNFDVTSTQFTLQFRPWNCEQFGNIKKYTKV